MKKWPSSKTLIFTHTIMQYTRDTAMRLGVVGWVENTKIGTVVGVAQGAESKVEQL